VADEGDGKTPADAADNPNAGLQKWVFNGSTWQLAYVLQTGLNLGTKYPVVGYDDPSLDPAPAGLRNLTGRVNDDGSVNIWAVTSTVSALTDQGADPNQLVTITDALGNTDPGVASTESFSVVRTAQSGEVLRGVSFAPGTINPTWTVTAAPPADGYGWNKTSVQVTLTPTVPKGDTPSVSYSLSGAQVGGPTLVASPAGFPVTAEGTTVVSFFAQNGAGSRSTTRTLTLNIDETAPTISGGLTPAPNANGWINSLPVTLAFTCADSLSGLVAPAPPPEILTAEVTGGSSPLTTCTDKAENSSSLTVSPINIDVTAPVVTAAASPSIIWPPNGKMVPVTISGTLRDARSGIDPSTARFTVVDQYGRVQPSGSFAVNADGTYSFKIALEASRDGADKNGRTYLVTISVSDLAGNSQSRTVAVLVPHDAASIK